MRRIVVLICVLMAVCALRARADDLKLPDPERALSDPAMEAIAGFLFSQQYEKAYITGTDRLLAADAPLTRYVRGVTDRLVRVVHLDRPDLQFELKVVQGADVNALCIPGGHIYVYTGLLDFIKDKFPVTEREDVLAACLGHEMAHAVLRHMLQNWARSAEYAAVLKDKETLRKLLLTTSRDWELEADRYGALYMLRAGYSVSAALDLYDKLPSSSSLESTHPSGGQRVRQLRQYIEQLKGIVALWNEGLRAANVHNHSLARICFGALKAEFPELPSVRNNLGWTLYALYQTSLPEDLRPSQQVTYAYIPVLGVILRNVPRKASAAAAPPRAGDTALLQAAQYEFQEATRLNPSMLAAYEGAAACALEAGNNRLATEMLDKAGRVNARDAALANLWGVVRERQGNVTAALVSYDRATKVDKSFLPAVYNLACLYLKQGRNGQAQQLLTKYVTVDRNGYWSDMARQHLQELGARAPAPASIANKPPRRLSGAAGVMLGSSPDEVKRLLGNPDETQALKTGATLLHYNRGIDIYLSPSGVACVSMSSPEAGQVLNLTVGAAAELVERTLGIPLSSGVGDSGETLWSYPALGLVIGVSNARVSSISVQR